MTGYPQAEWVGVLGDDLGGVTLAVVENAGDDPFFFGLSGNQCLWLFEQLRAFVQ